MTKHDFVELIFVSVFVFLVGFICALGALAGVSLWHHAFPTDVCACPDSGPCTCPNGKCTCTCPLSASSRHCRDTILTLSAIAVDEREMADKTQELLMKTNANAGAIIKDLIRKIDELQAHPVPAPAKPKPDKTAFAG